MYANLQSRVSQQHSLSKVRNVPPHRGSNVSTEKEIVPPCCWMPRPRFLINVQWWIRSTIRESLP